MISLLEGDIECTHPQKNTGPALVEKRFGKYTLTERLGGGGMAEVFKARLSGPEGFVKELALKLILPHFSSEPEFVKMFIHEATLVARLDHANIVRIHEFDQIDGRHYIAMELVIGRDLRAISARAREIDRPIDVTEALMIGLEACKGLAFAHGELTPGSPLIVHRDISPHNLIISQAGELKITDFGIAKMSSAASITKTGVIKGKVSYMSPEQARGDTLDGRSDLFSLGCVLWEMLSGQRLFSGENDLAVLARLQKCEILPASRFNSQVAPQVDEVLQKLLQRSPQSRFSTASELSSELDKLLVETSSIDRATILVQLYRDLFPGTGSQTDVFQTVQHVEKIEVIDEDQKIEPIGPDGRTEISKVSSDELPPALVEKKSKRKMIWLIVLSLSCITGFAVVVANGWLSKKPDADQQKAVIHDKPVAIEPLAPDNLKLEILPAQAEPETRHPEEEKVVFGRLDL
ncbi:MAG: serine/threonine protein kinase, partial [Deltaproteobacteria bacterium]|nr:serine/threonine protein kinase [Deltaproteobacteria bacterium]